MGAHQSLCPAGELLIVMAPGGGNSLFKGVAPGELTILQQVTPHLRVYRKHKLNLVDS